MQKALQPLYHWESASEGLPAATSPRSWTKQSALVDLSPNTEANPELVSSSAATAGDTASTASSSSAEHADHAQRASPPAGKVQCVVVDQT